MKLRPWVLKALHVSALALFLSLFLLVLLYFRGLDERVRMLERQPSYTVLVQPTAEPTATPSATKVPVRKVVSPVPSK